VKAVKFEGDINHDSIKMLLADIDKIDLNENIVLYFTSGGGMVTDKDILVDYINRNPKRFEIVCYWEMSSCAFDLLVNVRCKIRLGQNCLAKIHLYSNELKYYNLGDSKSIDVFLLNDLNKRNKIWFEQLKRADCTLEEIEFLKLGNDLILDVNRMAHIIKSIRNNK